jgi:hypothetical protein
MGLFKKAQGGHVAALQGPAVEERRGQRLRVEQEETESAICVAILAEMAMLRKNQDILDGKVAKGMWQSWKMLELQSIRRREIPVRKRIKKCKLQNEKCKLVDGSSAG